MVMAVEQKQYWHQQTTLKFAICYNAFIYIVFNLQIYQNERGNFTKDGNNVRQNLLKPKVFDISVWIQKVSGQVLSEKAGK